MKKSTFAIPFFILYILFFIFYPTPAFANTSPPTTNVNSNVPHNLHNWTQSVMIEVMSALSCQLTGLDPTNPKQSCLGIDQNTGKIGFLPSPQTGGAIGVMANMISMLYNIPVHAQDYINYLTQNFGIATKTFAQNPNTGAGFTGLSPLLPIWTAARNIVYLIFTIIFVLIGFAIMFRVRIDPRTVMTIQNQIPKIIIGIILVTFSYAISGLLIDLMYVSMYLVFEIFSSIPGNTGIASLNPAVLQGTNPFSAVGESFGISKIAGEVSFGTARLMNQIFTGAALGPIGIIAWPIISFLGFLVIAIAMLWSLFRLWFELIYAFVYILISVVLSPFWIALGLLPGNPINFTGWLRFILAYLFEFPLAIGLFLLGKTFIDAFANQPLAFVPPLIGNPASSNPIGAIIGLCIILLSSNVRNMSFKIFKAPKIDIGRITQSVGVGAGVPISAVKTGATSIIGGSEWIPSGPAGGFKQRGAGLALFGRLFGR